MPRGDGRGPRYGSTVSPVFPPWGGGPWLTPSVPPDVRFVTEESFDFGVLSSSDRYRRVVGTGHPVDGNRGDRAPHGWDSRDWAPHIWEHVD